VTGLRCAVVPTLRQAFALVALALGVPAFAGFEEGVAAARKRDYATAFVEFKQAAEAGDARAYARLGYLYATGLGTARDPETGYAWVKKGADAGVRTAITIMAALTLEGVGTSRDPRAALEWARKAARVGDPDAQYLVYQAIQALPDSAYRQDGSIDPRRYEELAARPVDGRPFEVEMIDALYGAAAGGHEIARITLAGFFVDSIGGGNNRRAAALYATVPRLPDQLAAIARGAQALDRMGETRATLKLSRDVARTVNPGLRVVAARLSGDQGKLGCKDVKLLALALDGPIEGAEYLPYATPQLARAYLVRGKWQERWTWDVCETKVETPIEFTADGLGGARFVSRAAAK